MEHKLNEEFGRIAFESGECLTLDAYPDETEPCVFAKKLTEHGVTRTFLRLTLRASAETVCALFTAGAAYSLLGVSGGVTDLSGYCVPGDVVDHRDGRVTVYMGEKTEGEKKYDELEKDCADLFLELKTGGTANE